MPVAQDKKALRARMRKLRRGISGAEAGNRLCRIFQAAVREMGLDPANGPTALYVPIDGEIDTTPLAKMLRSAGHRLCLPVVTGKDAPLRFRLWPAGSRLTPGIGGAQEPSDGMPEMTPVGVVAPVVAFDWNGFRLGMGGGFYDRTLFALRASGRVLAVGAAHEEQYAQDLPKADHDQRLDWIVTDKRAVSVAMS